MILNRKIIPKILSVVMTIVGIAMLVPFCVSIIYEEFDVAKSFIICALPLVVAGLAGIKFLPKQNNSTLRIRDGFFIVAATWIVMSLIGSLPFIISGAIPNFADAFFETASGFSTTGSTILNDIESLPKGILFWRSFTHWIGGMGILVLTIALLPMLGIGGQKIMRAETTGPTMDKISFTINEGAKQLYIIYGVFTLIEVVLLGICGMDLFDAVTHSFGTLGTGGFSTYNDSIAHFNSLPIEIVITVFMLIAGVNFNLYYMLIFGKGKGVFKDPEFKTYVGIVVGSIVIICASLCITNTYGSVFESIRKTVFQVASIISSTGYATADFDIWPSTAKIVIILLMFIGGCASSTAGGVKVIRVMLLMKIIKRSVQNKLNPRAVTSIKLGGKEVSDETLNGVAAFLSLFTVLLFAGTFIITLTGVDGVTAFTSSLTCLSNIGPGLNLIGPTCNFAFYPGIIKILLSFYMIAGRLELFTIFLLITPDFWDKNN